VFDWFIDRDSGGFGVTDFLELLANWGLCTLHQIGQCHDSCNQ